MEQFLDYRQVPTATEANETNQEISNGHAEEVKETLNKDETDEKGWYYFMRALTKEDWFEFWWQLWVSFSVAFGMDWINWQAGWLIEWMTERTNERMNDRLVG